MSSVELKQLRARVALLACLCIAAFLVASVASTAIPSKVAPRKVKIVGLNPDIFKLSQEEVSKALRLAQNSSEYRELLKEGFKLVGAHPILKVKLHMEGGTAPMLKVVSAEKMGVVLMLERGSEKACVVVYSNGLVKVSRENLAISGP